MPGFPCTVEFSCFGGLLGKRAKRKRRRQRSDRGQPQSPFAAEPESETISSRIAHGEGRPILRLTGPADKRVEVERHRSFAPAARGALGSTEEFAPVAIFRAIRLNEGLTRAYDCLQNSTQQSHPGPQWRVSPHSAGTP